MSGAAPTLAAVAWISWAFALAAAWTLRRRMERVADAEHELRGAATAIGLTIGGDAAVELQLARMTAALADLREARGAGPPPAADLEAGRLAQVMGNVIANAAEHGVGPVEVRAERVAGGRTRLVLGNRDRPPAPGRPAQPGPGRGRGVAIAKRAAGKLGGWVSVESDDGFTRTVIELRGLEAIESEPPERREDGPRAA